MDMKNIICFLGLPRMPKRFKRSIEEMKYLRRNGIVEDIIFVTWKNRLDDKPEVRKFIIEEDVKVISRHESKFGGRHNIWHQMRALDIALDVVPDGYSMLKTRSDVHIDKEFLKNLFTGSIKYLNKKPNSGVFESRMWVPFFEIQSPFYLCDYCFWGSKSDISKLVNYDASYDAIYQLVNGVPETRRYIHPYMKEFTFLDPYLKYYRGPSRDPSLLKDRRKLISNRFKSDVFAYILSFYYKCMMSDFYIDYSPVSFKNNDPFERRFKNEYISTNEVSSKVSFEENFYIGMNEGKHSVYCTNTDWLIYHFKGEYSSDVPEKIADAMDNQFEFWRKYEVDDRLAKQDRKREDNYFYERLKDNSFLKNNATLAVYNKIIAPLGLDRIFSNMYQEIIRR